MSAEETTDASCESSGCEISTPVRRGCCGAACGSTCRSPSNTGSCGITRHCQCGDSVQADVSAEALADTLAAELGLIGEPEATLGIA